MQIGIGLSLIQRGGAYPPTSSGAQQTLLLLLPDGSIAVVQSNATYLLPSGAVLKA